MARRYDAVALTAVEKGLHCGDIAQSLWKKGYWYHQPLPVFEIWMSERRGVPCPQISLQPSFTMMLLSLQGTPDNQAELEVKSIEISQATPALQILKCEKMHLLLWKSAKSQHRNTICIKNSGQNHLMPGEVKCNLFAQALHHLSLWKAEKQQWLHLKSLKWQMRWLNCPADKDALSPDNLTRGLAEMATELFVTCQSTCYKWERIPQAN